MNQTSIASREPLSTLRPLALLGQLANTAANGSLKVVAGSVSWWVYLEEGKVIYASHSVDPLDRFERNLRCLSYQVPTLTSEVRTQIRLRFTIEQDVEPLHNAEYQAIGWLVEQQSLTHAQAATLVEALVKEVFESLLLVADADCHFIEKQETQPVFYKLDIPPLVEHCRKQLQGWQALGPQVWSPYQRPYFFTQPQSQQELLPDLRQKLAAMLKGFSFRHLAVLLNQDELLLARRLQPYIQSGTIFLREPQPPFDQLPKISVQPLELVAPASATVNLLDTQDSGLPDISSTGLAKAQYTIACVDDSPTILSEISRFLDDKSFLVFTIDDSLKALMQIVRVKPDLILLDVGMPGMDGYKLCRLLRNHSLFKATPIVMVTGNTGIIDRAKAKLVGASDYLTKPFTQSDLLKMVFRHLA